MAAWKSPAVASKTAEKFGDVRNHKVAEALLLANSADVETFPSWEYLDLTLVLFVPSSRQDNAFALRDNNPVVTPALSDMSSRPNHHNPFSSVSVGRPSPTSRLAQPCMLPSFAAASQFLVSNFGRTTLRGERIPLTSRCYPRRHNTSEYKNQILLEPSNCIHSRISVSRILCP